MQPRNCLWSTPFGVQDIECLENLLVYQRGSGVSVKLTLEANTVYEMWRLSKAGHLKCFEYYSYVDEKGSPIVNKEDIITLLYMDDLDARGERRLERAEATRRQAFQGR